MQRRVLQQCRAATNGEPAQCRRRGIIADSKRCPECLGGGEFTRIARHVGVDQRAVALDHRPQPVPVEPRLGDLADIAEISVFQRRHGEQSAADVDAPVLVVSQFTLYADTRKGRRPSWSAAAPGPVSQPLYESFCDSLMRRGARVERGVFGATMEVELVNDGPMTVLVEV